MEYKYKNNMYDKEAKIIIAVAAMPSLFFILRGYQKLGLIIGVIGIAAAIALTIFSSYQGKFSFIVEGNFLRVMYKKKAFDFMWQDIDNIKEDEKGLVVNISNKDLRFSILKDMVKYKEFKAEIIDKALEYRIPIKFER